MNSYYNRAQFLPGNIKETVKNITPNLVANSLQYRAAEFNEIDWKNSVVMFGCSNVFGIGLDEKDTIAKQLEAKISRPVINMGVPASSMMYSLINQIALAEICDKPYAVVNLWTSVDRQVYFLENQPRHLGAWLTEDQITSNNSSLNLRKYRHIYSMWNFESSNAALHSISIKRTVDLLWKRTKHIQGSFFENTSSVLNVDFYETVDFALDETHPGAKSALQAAEKIAAKLERR